VKKTTFGDQRRHKSVLPDFLEQFFCSKFKLWGDIKRSIVGMPRTRGEINSHKQVTEILQYIADDPVARQAYVSFAELQDSVLNIPILPVCKARKQHDVSTTAGGRPAEAVGGAHPGPIAIARGGTSEGVADNAEIIAPVANNT
jgi:hypothetical protein